MGTYDHREIVELVTHLSETTGTSIPDLLRAFGEYLFKRFPVLFPAHFAGVGSTFRFLATLDSKIHPEVKKLYPDAELPSFEHAFPTPDRMILEYRSQRPFADFAEGLLRGCIDHFGERIALTREDLACATGAHTLFLLVRASDGGRH